MKTADNVIDLQGCDTPEDLYNAIEKLLMPVKEGTSPEVDLEMAFNNAKTAVIRFRRVYPKLSHYQPSPNVKDDTTTGLQEIANWCIDAIVVVDNMIWDLDGGIIEEIIGLHKKLKNLPATDFPTIDQNLWIQATRRAQKIVDKHTMRTGKPGRRRGGTYHDYGRRTKFEHVAHIIFRLREVANRKATATTLPSCPSPSGPKMLTDQINEFEKLHDEAFTDVMFYRAVEKIYRIIDKNYTNSLAQLEQGICEIFDRLKELYSTPTGDLLDKYAKLSGLKLEERCNRIVQAYSIDSLVESTIFGPKMDEFFFHKERESIVDGVVESLEEIKGKIERHQKAEAAKNTTHRKNQTKIQESKFKPWPESGDARLVIDKQRVKFYHGGDIKDLRIKNDTQTHNLLFCLTSGSMQPKEIADKISPGTQVTAAKIVDYANQLLNRKVRAVGFSCLPDYDVEFISRDSFGHYVPAIPIQSVEDFESWQREQTWQ